MNMHSYLEIVAEQIRCKRARSAVLEELQGHIEDQKQAYMADGMTGPEAEEEAVRQMGDGNRAGPGSQAQDGLASAGSHSAFKRSRALSAVADLPAAGLRLQGGGDMETGTVSGPGTCADDGSVLGRLYDDWKVCLSSLAGSCGSECDWQVSGRVGFWHVIPV